MVAEPSYEGSGHSRGEKGLAGVGGAIPAVHGQGGQPAGRDQEGEEQEPAPAVSPGLPRVGKLGSAHGTIVAPSDRPFMPDHSQRNTRVASAPQAKA